ncbi:GroES-like protein [Xylaria sp. FL0064]|nr:GroES-like protein [Xylaria sp. FL0064]
MAPTNKAAFYPSDKAPALEVGTSPYPTPGPKEVIIKVAAAAINPVDSTIQHSGQETFPFLTYPLVGGLDVAGTIAEVGPNTNSKFHPGDRVLGFACDFTSRTGGFQEYVAVPASVVSRLPEDASLIEASIIPSGIATAAEALYSYLGLAHPTIPPHPRNGQTILIAGGASVVGSNAIQLAVASGYEVLTTSSPSNFAHCTSLGASRVFDYRDPNLTQNLLAALKGKHCAGGVSCVPASNSVVFEVVSASEGSKRVACTILFTQDGVPGNITTEMIHAYHIKDTPLADGIFDSWLPAALASGQYKRGTPRPRVVGEGLESVQAALDIIAQPNSVSCEKLVVTLGGEA